MMAIKYNHISGEFSLNAQNRTHLSMSAYIRYAHNDREEANIFFHYMLRPTDEVSLLKSVKYKNCYVPTVLA